MLGGRTRSAPLGQATFGDALRTRTFALLYFAELQSIVGDQFARIALAVLVYRRTGSAAATGLIFAATYLPAIVGSAALGHLADRLPRRAVIVAVEALRAALLAVMAVPGVPLAVVVGLLVVSVFVGPLFSAAQISYLAGALPREVFRAANGLRMFGSQGAQVLGFAVGGPLVAALGAHPVLALDAASFVLSALLAVAAIAPGLPPAAEVAAGGDVRTARAAVWENRRVRRLVLMSALAGFYVAPEGVAVPLAHQLDGSTTDAGLLLAALPLGSVLGVYLLVRRVPAGRRTTTAALMAIGCGVPLVASGLAGNLVVAGVCWILAGALAAFQVEALTQIVQGIPDGVRARSLGICNAILLGVQGLGVGAFGAFSDATTPAASVAVAGALGTVCAVALVTAAVRNGDARGAGVPSADARLDSGEPETAGEAVAGQSGRHRRGD